MRRRPIFRHALAIEREYRGRLLHRVRAIATHHAETTRRDASDLGPIVGLLAVARQVARFIGRQVDRAILALAIQGAPVVAPKVRPIAEGIALDAPPSMREQALYTTWADAQAAAVAANEARLRAELGTRPDALTRAETRARNIARDGIGWLTGGIVELRSRSAGVTGYVWQTQEDEKVREMHAALADTFQRWEDPPVTNPEGDRNPPGGDWGCRCFGVPAWDAEAGSRTDAAAVPKSKNAALFALLPWYVLPKLSTEAPAGSVLFAPDYAIDAANLDDEDRQDIIDHDRAGYAFPDRDAAIEYALMSSGYVGCRGSVCPPLVLRSNLAAALPTAFYGTGKAGGTHHWRLAGAPRLADGQIPGLIRETIAGVDGGPAAVPGLDVEVYDVAPDALAWLDAYEGPAFVRVDVALTDGRVVGFYRYEAGREP